MFLSRKDTLFLYVPLNVTHTNICTTLLVSGLFFKMYIRNSVVHCLKKYKLSAIEQGRYNQTVHSHCICRFCVLNRSKDEYHFILECPKYGHFQELKLIKASLFQAYSVAYRILRNKKQILVNKPCIFLQKAIEYKDNLF